MGQMQTIAGRALNVAVTIPAAPVTIASLVQSHLESKGTQVGRARGFKVYGLTAAGGNRAAIRVGDGPTTAECLMHAASGVDFYEPVGDITRHYIYAPGGPEADVTLVIYTG